MIKYRISKYNPSFRGPAGKYLEDTWTSYNDIGKIYEGKVFSKKDYLITENQYIKVLLFLLNYFNIKSIKIKHLENYFSINEIERLLKKKGLTLTSQDKIIISSLADEKMVGISQLDNYLKLILRECFWCKLEDDLSLVSIEFGYDFYVYITCNAIANNIITKFSQENIYIEKCIS